MLDPVYVFVPLNALFPGFNGGLSISVPLITKDSPFAIDCSPSHAKNPIFESISEVTSILVSVMDNVGLLLETPSNPSNKLI